MTKMHLLAGTALAAFAAATAAQAQVGTRPGLTPVESVTGAGVTEQIEDIQIRTQRELAQSEDRARFGTAAVPEGFTGSLSLTGVATGGNTDTVDVGAAGSFTLGSGRLSHSLGVAIEYGEADDETDRNRILGVYDLNYDVTERLYGFGLVRAEYDEFDANEIDAFAGVGPGIRIINRPDAAWRLQAGPGIRYINGSGADDSETELAGIVASRAYFRIASDVFLTNDTDLLYSDDSTLVSNDLALNTRLSGPLSARVGLRTDWNSDAGPDFDDFDNTMTLGVVYSFQ